MQTQQMLELITAGRNREVNLSGNLADGLRISTQRASGEEFLPRPFIADAGTSPLFPFRPSTLVTNASKSWFDYDILPVFEKRTRPRTTRG